MGVCKLRVHARPVGDLLGAIGLLVAAPRAHQGHAPREAHRVAALNLVVARVAHALGFLNFGRGDFNQLLANVVDEDLAAVAAVVLALDGREARAREEALGHVLVRRPAFLSILVTPGRLLLILVATRGARRRGRARLGDIGSFGGLLRLELRRELARELRVRVVGGGAAAAAAAAAAPATHPTIRRHVRWWPSVRRLRGGAADGRAIPGGLPVHVVDVEGAARRRIDALLPSRRQRASSRGWRRPWRCGCHASRRRPAGLAGDRIDVVDAARVGLREGGRRAPERVSKGATRAERIEVTENASSKETQNKKMGPGP